MPVAKIALETGFHRFFHAIHRLFPALKSFYNTKKTTDDFSFGLNENLLPLASDT